MKYTVVFYLMLLGALLFSCKREVASTNNTNSYLADLHVRYLEKEKNLKATASFFQQTDTVGQLLPWRPEGSVLFQSSSMEEKNIQNGLYRYIAESSGLSFEPPFQFSFSKGREKAVLTIKPIGALSSENPVSKQKGLRINVEGGQLLDRESMVFLFSDANNKAYSSTIEGPQQENSFWLSPEAIKDWPTGEGQLYLVKKQYQIKTAGNWTYQTQIEYYSQTIELKIEK